MQPGCVGVAYFLDRRGTVQTSVQGKCGSVCCWYCCCFGLPVERQASRTSSSSCGAEHCQTKFRFLSSYFLTRPLHANFSGRSFANCLCCVGGFALRKDGEQAFPQTHRIAHFSFFSIEPRLVWFSHCKPAGKYWPCLAKERVECVSVGLLVENKLFSHHTWHSQRMCVCVFFVQLLLRMECPVAYLFSHGQRWQRSVAATQCCKTASVFGAVHSPISIASKRPTF